MSVDGRYDIELNGQGLPVKSYQKLSEDIYVSPRDLTTSAGESPLSSFWWQKRFSDFSGGGGQKYAEAKNAQENRILDSQDLDFSIPGEAKLIKAMAVSLSKTGTNGYLLSAAGYLWLVDGTNIYYYNGTAWSAAVATGVTGNVVCVADDGNNLYGAGTSGGIWANTAGAGAFAAWATGTGSQPTAMAFINKQLYGVQGSKLYKLVTGASQSTEVFDAGTGFTLNWITGHNQKIAFGGYRGSAGDERSYVWESDGTASGTTLLVDDLPDGYKGYGGLSYLDVLYIWGGYELTAGSTAAGILYAYTNGALQIAGQFKEAADMGNPGRQTVPVIDTIPRCALPDGQFVYFGMNERTGLWRYDLKEGGLHRAFSAATTNNLVTGVATYKGKIYLAYSGAGAFVEQTTYQSSGLMKLPITTFGTSNQKLGRKIILASMPPSPTVNYDANALPASATPAWTRTASGGVTQSVSGGILTTSSDTTASSRQYYELADTDLDATVGITVEFRLKVDTLNDTSQEILVAIGGDTKNATVQFVKSAGIYYVRVYSADTDGIVSYAFDPTDDYHVYRLTLLNSTAKLYIDGTLVITNNNMTSSGWPIVNQGIGFGDYASSAKAHTEYWDYIRYWETGAFVPGELALASDPFTVEVSVDGGTSYSVLTGDSSYKNYSLVDVGLWDSLLTRITLTNSSLILKDITIEAVPTLPNTNYWELVVPLSDTIDTLDGSEESINAQEVYEAYQTARDNKIPITFKEKDYDIQTTQTTKKVLIEKLDQLNPVIEDGILESCDLKIKLREF